MPHRLIATLASLLVALPPLAAAQSPAAPERAAAAEAAAPAPQPELADLLWSARPLVIFADTANDPRYAQQLALIAQNPDALADRLVVVLADTDPAANGPLRRQLRPRGFGVVLIDTDGTIVQRRPAPTSVRELSGMIDRLPSRRQETGSRRQ